MQTLKVDSVTLEFSGRTILQGAYLSCKTGEIIGLLGRNGCGKSSLLKIIFGSLKPQYKYVAIDDAYIDKGYHQNQIAYLPQHNYLPQGIRISKLAKPLVDDALWNDFAATTSYQKYHHKKAGELSGGELRQLEMLMVLYSRAPFVLLDEPFTHVSPIQAEELKDTLRHISKFKGIVLTDHQYENILEVSSTIILMSHGYTKYIDGRDDLVAYGYLRA